jgi:hypothetical protein
MPIIGRNAVSDAMQWSAEARKRMTSTRRQLRSMHSFVDVTRAALHATRAG